MCGPVARASGEVVKVALISFRFSCSSIPGIEARIGCQPKILVNFARSGSSLGARGFASVTEPNFNASMPMPGTSRASAIGANLTAAATKIAKRTTKTQKTRVRAGGENIDFLLNYWRGNLLLGL